MAKTPSAATAAAVNQLLRTFNNNNLDREVLESVLEMFNNDVKAAETFLRSQGQNDFIDPGPATQVGGALPPDYHKKPASFSLERLQSLCLASNKLATHPATEMKAFFLKENSSFGEHLDQQKRRYDVYLPVLVQLLGHGVDLNQTTKSKILAAAWARSDHKLADFCLSRKGEVFGLIEILKALKSLDAPRRLRALEKRLQRMQGSGHCRPKTLGALRAKINEVKREITEGMQTSVSGALARHVRAWIRSVPRENLEFFALQMPREPWQELADLVHCKSDDFQLPWFLDVCFGKPPPADSLLSVRGASASVQAIAPKPAAAPAAAAKPAAPAAAAAAHPKGRGAGKAGARQAKRAAAKAAAKPAAKAAAAVVPPASAPSPAVPAAEAKEPVALAPEPAIKEKPLTAEVVRQMRVPYSFLRKQVQHFGADLKAAVASFERMDVLLWYYEELACPEVDALIASRLEKGDEPAFSYGKLMERLLYMQLNRVPFAPLLVPIAEKRLHQIHLPLDPPVVVLGDASYSMDVAIRTATVIGSLLTALAAADLRFFNVANVAPHVVPRSIPQVLEVATQTRADGLTAPAVCLWDYYSRKAVVKFFVVVTDEIENAPHAGFYFHQLAYKYITEVNASTKFVFVSFLEDPKQKGRMVVALEQLGIVPLQFRLDARRPDLTKVDTLLGLLASETEGFARLTEELGALVRAGGDLQAVLAHLAKSAPVAAPAPPPAAAAPVQIPAAALRPVEEKVAGNKEEKAALAQSKEDDSCAICMSAKSTTALVECGHLLCSGCAAPLVGKDCPICRQKVIRLLKIFKV